MRYSTAVAFAIGLFLCGEVEGQADATPIGDFYYMESKDAMTDDPRDFTFVPDSEQEIAFGVKCMTEGPQPIILVQSPMLNMRLISMDESAKVQYRFDSQDPVGPRNWPYMASNNAVIAPSTVTEDLIGGARASVQLAVRIYNSDGDHVATREFSMKGATAAFDRLRCVE
jgi:hypothetical protein